MCVYEKPELAKVNQSNLTTKQNCGVVSIIHLTLRTPYDVASLHPNP